MYCSTKVIGASNRRSITSVTCSHLDWFTIGSIIYYNKYRTYPDDMLSEAMAINFSEFFLSRLAGIVNLIISIEIHYIEV